MSEIIIRDSLRASIEAASGGKQTVLYTKKGQPSFVNIIEKQNIEVLNPALSAKTGLTGVHPAFTVNGVVKDVLFVGTYNGILSDGEIVSSPYAIPNQQNYSMITALNALKNMGSGWHCMTHVELALIKQLAKNRDHFPLGANAKGYSRWNELEKGNRTDRLKSESAATSASKIFTGSGGVAFRHDGQYNGISDIVGDGYLSVAGARIAGGELQVLGVNNNAAIFNSSVMSSTYLPTADDWKAIDATTGAMVTPTYTGSLSEGTYVATTNNTVKIATSGSGTTLLVMPSAGYQSIVVEPTGGLNNTVRGLLELWGIYPSATLFDFLKQKNMNAATNATYSYIGLATGAAGMNACRDALDGFVFSNRPETYSGSLLSTDSSDNTKHIRPVYYE